MSIPSESSYLTCPHFKSRISDVSADTTTLINNSSEIDQTGIFHPKIGGEFCTTIPRCSAKFIHNNQKGINSKRILQYRNSLVFHYEHENDVDNNNNAVCLNELRLNSMFNKSQVCCSESDINNNNNNSYEYFKFPCHHHLLYCNQFINNNINKNCDNNNNNY
ncbi:unnamed protein product [Trichobilharzia szidati]|nr:unnamed protein product [Trichobilharzia szidati]